MGADSNLRAYMQCTQESESVDCAELKIRTPRFIYKNNKQMGNERRQIMIKSVSSPQQRSVARIALHQYGTKSLEVRSSGGTQSVSQSHYCHPYYAYVWVRMSCDFAETVIGAT